MLLNNQDQLLENLLLLLIFWTQNFNDFVQQNIFDSLDMRDTYWNMPPKSKLSRVVVIADMETGGKGKSASVPTESSYYSGSVGLISTARDYLLFEEMLLNKGTYKGHELITAKSVELMSADHVGKLFSAGGKGKGNGEGFGYSVSVILEPEAAEIPKSKGAFGWAGADVGAAGRAAAPRPRRRLPSAARECSGRCPR